MSWQDVVKEEQKEHRAKVQTIHVSLPGRAHVYHWLKDQSRKYDIPLARLVAAILDDAYRASRVIDTKDLK